MECSCGHLFGDLRLASCNDVVLYPTPAPINNGAATSRVGAAGRAAGGREGPTRTMRGHSGVGFGEGHEEGGSSWSTVDRHGWPASGAQGSRSADSAFNLRLGHGCRESGPAVGLNCAGWSQAGLQLAETVRVQVGCTTAVPELSGLRRVAYGRVILGIWDPASGGQILEPAGRRVPVRRCAVAFCRIRLPASGVDDQAAPARDSTTAPHLCRQTQAEAVGELPFTSQIRDP